MEFSEIIPLPKLHVQYKEDFDQSFSNDEELLENAFSYGPFHEEEFSVWAIGEETFQRATRLTVSAYRACTRPRSFARSYKKD
jgi:hypothetical protein